MKWIVFFAFFLLASTVELYADTAVSSIQGTASEIRGTAKFTDTPEGLQAEIEILGAPPGEHGIHIHEFGSCDDQANAAGGHFNPESAPHGFLPKDGLKNAHAGDFGNIEIGKDGHGMLKLTLPDLEAKIGIHGVEGRTIVLHEKTDDFGQPAGNAGARIACGIIRLEQ